MSNDSVMPLMCPNCGAPRRGTECEYCGSVFWTLESKHTPVKVEFEGERTVRVYDSESKRWMWVADKTSVLEENPLLQVKTSKPITEKRWT